MPAPDLAAADVAAALEELQIRSFDEEALIVGELEIRLSVAGDPMVATFVANGHVEEGAGDVTAATRPGFPFTRCGPVGLARAAATVVEVGSLLHTARVVAVSERLVAARGVVAAVRGEQVVAVGVGVVSAVVIGETVRFGPRVLALVCSGSTGTLGVASVLVYVEDIVRIVGILVGQVEDIPGIDRRRGVRVEGVIVDHIVQSQSQYLSVRGVDR